jgi:RHS repeat-associated protein
MRRTCLFIMRLWVAAPMLIALAAAAADKNGVAPNSVSLPKGPGSIEGLGDSFQPSLNTGTAKYGLGIKVPPGTAGHQPALSLSYEGGGANGPLGCGWSIPLPCIQRRTEDGIPTYGESLGVNRPDTFMNDAREELVPAADGFFFCENESSFVRYRRVGGHWEGTMPNGTRLEYGLTAAGRIAEAGSTNVFRWLLERETDTRGNVIEYVYRSFAGDRNLNQKYLSEVRYGPGAPPRPAFHFIALEYEDRPDWFEDGRAGFLIRTGKRLKSIRIATQGVSLTNHLAGDFNADGATDSLNRRYDLDYLSYAGAASHWSLLARVTVFGADGVTALPPATFDYAVSHPPNSIDASINVWSSSNAPIAVMDNALVDLIDLNADGLPDLLKTEASGGGHTAAINRGPARVGDGWAIGWSDPVSVAANGGTSWNFDLASENTHLADMNGDGLADLVHKTGDDAVFYFANHGRTNWSVRRDMVLQDSAPPAPFGNPGVRLADIDFDKRIDIIQSLDPGGSVAYRVWFNLGDQTYSAPHTVEPEGGFDFALAGVHVVDCNGDRVPDIARIQPGAVQVAAGLGYGRFAEAVSLVLPDLTLDDLQIARAKLADINGDGLADLVLERAAPGECWYWLNLGNHTFDVRRIITGLPTASSGSAVRWADLNGNGTTDLIYADSSAQERLQMVELGELLSGGLAPNLLTRIANGIGRVTTLEYAPSTQFALADAAANRPWPDALPFPVTVVSAMTTSDSLGHEYVTRYRYHDGYYEPLEKQFRGFAEVEQIEIGDASAPTLVTRSYFDTGRFFDAMKGRVLRVTAGQTDGPAFWDETTTWADPPRTLTTGTNGAVVRFAHAIATRKDILDLGQGEPRRLETELEYDNFGNQIRVTNHGVVEGTNRAAFNDERVTTTEFAINTNAWIVRRVKRAQVADEHGELVARTETFYDDETFSGENLGVVTVGNLTLQRAWIFPSNASAFIQATRIRYDAYGNPVALLDPLAKSDGPADGHARELAYDAQFHTYTVRELIHVGNGQASLESRAVHDPGLGTLTGFTDFNGFITSYSYDALARLTEIRQPGDEPGYPSMEYHYETAQPVTVPGPLGPIEGGGVVNFVETRALDQDPGTAPDKQDHYKISRQYVDGLGRALMARMEAEPAPGLNEPRVAISDVTLFNARQKPMRVLQPCFGTGTGTLEEQLAFEHVELPGWQGQFHRNGELAVLGLNVAPATTNTYDALLRPTETIHPDGTSARTEYEPLVRRLFDENDTDSASPHSNTPTIQVSDGLGRLIRVDEWVRLNDDGTPAGQVNVWTTRYEYDLNDALTRIADSQNNVRTMRYDGLKRKLWMNDPDAGVSTNRYDDASNLIETTDAKGQRIRFTFDGANRILTEDYLDEASAEFSYHRSPDIAYFYDEPADTVDLGDGTRGRAQNTRGRLAYVDDPSGQEHSSFDARGRVEWMLKRIPNPQQEEPLVPRPSDLVSYRTRFDYDSMDRLERVVYPDNDEVRYRYNARGLVQWIGGTGRDPIVPAIEYLPSAQEGRMEYGNGVRTTHTYDVRQRVASLVTTDAVRGIELIHLDYTLDAASNVRRITDARPASGVEDSRRNTQHFAYDDLYRLTQVRYNAPLSGTNGGEIHYRYDRIGNLLAQTSDIAHLEGGRPVADLGAMGYGGTAGRSGRIGRQPDDPPGPHALSEIQNSKAEKRSFSYDANGNVSGMDGLRCTWDFKDRLVAVEDDAMRAEYLYDYSGSRVVKRIWPTTQGRPVSSVVYVDRTFEVRPPEQPVKYVFNGDTRVAQVAGSLSNRDRIQRLRLLTGWNLVGLGVTAPGLREQLMEAGGGQATSPVAKVFWWNPGSGEHAELEAGKVLPSGSVLWINARTNAVVAVTGAYRDPTNTIFPAGGSFHASPGLETLALSRLGTNHVIWHHNADGQMWARQADEPFGSFAGVPEFLSPGSAVFVQSEQAAELELSPPRLRTLFYHGDHLGSASVITDGNGRVVEETAYYPFGTPRWQRRVELAEAFYGFTQKERDRESGLAYFESRFLATSLGRFLRLDPLGGDMPAGWLENPQKLNHYAYVQNNPLRWVDPSGMEEQKPKNAPAPSGPQRVLVMYGDDMYTDQGRKSGLSRAAYENLLRQTYQAEAGPNATVVVKALKLKESGDLAGVFKGGSYDAVIYNGHAGMGKELFPGGDVRLTPQDIHDALSEAKVSPKKFFFYGCNTEKSGFVRVLSELRPNSEVTGTGNYVAQNIAWDGGPKGRTNYRVVEDRDHNITYKGGKETHNVRKVDIKALQEAGLPRP